MDPPYNDDTSQPNTSHTHEIRQGFQSGQNFTSTETLTASMDILEDPRAELLSSSPELPPDSKLGSLSTSLEVPVVSRTSSLAENPSKEVFTVYFSSCSVDGDDSGSSSSDYEAVATGSTSDRSSCEDSGRYLDDELRDIYNIFQSNSNDPSRF